MHLHRSHDVNQLAAALGDLVAARPLPWHRQEVVAVQGQGMERWLSMNLAERFGGVLGLEHVFPRALVERILVATLGPVATGLSAWGDAALTWRVLSVLPELLQDEAMEPIRRYLGADADSNSISARRLALARELASLIDRYATYRPDMFRAWLAGAGADAEDAWQPMLARALRKQLDLPCHAEVVAEAIAKLRSGAPIAGLPERVSLFGVTTLPPMYIELFDALSVRTEVHLFWLAPTPHYFADLSTERELARARMRGEAVDATAATEVGHPLLASLGRAARDFQSVIYGVCERLVEEDDRFEPEPDASTVLGRLKHDLHALEPTGASEAHPPVAFPENDRTFVVHACHGRMRQVEALRDEILRAFVELPDLEPRDVVVLCPDVDAYAPLVRAVFGEGDDASAERGNRVGFPRIPVRVADSAARHEASAIDGFLAIVALCGGRFAAPDVADVLVRPAVARRFALDAAEPATLIRLLRETGMRWGIDGEHRETFGQPNDEAFTLRRGLARLLLGQAMRGEDARAYREVLPYDDAGDRGMVEGLVEAMETLFAFGRALKQKRSPADFATFVAQWFDRLVDLSNDETGQRRTVLDALAAELAQATEMKLETELDADAQRSLLEHALTSTRGPSRLLGGAVSVASLVPMRAIPFRMVCLLGLDEAEFPRRTTGRGFDLTERDRRPGDRRVEDDDRAAMLEAILSAGERLVLTYQGRDPHSNDGLPMAAPVAELLDTIVTSYLPSTSTTGVEREKAKADVTGRIVVEHSLHAFGAKEVAARAPTSFDTRLVAQAEALANTSAGDESAWVDKPLPLRGQDEAGRLLVRVSDLLRFFDDPIRAFLEKRARIDLDPSHEELEDREPYEVDSLERAKLAGDVLRMSRDGIPGEIQRDRLRIAGRLPVGRAGDLLFAEVRYQTDALLSLATPVLRSNRLAPVEIDRTLKGIPVGGEPVDVRLVGAIDDRFALGRVRIRPGKRRLKHQLRVFLEQSVAAAAGDLAEPTHFFALGENGEATGHRYETMHEPDGYLATALSVYLEGSRLPLPFTLDAAKAFLDEENKASKKNLGPEEATAKALRKARDSLDAGYMRKKDSERLDLRRLFGTPPSRELFTDGFGPASALRFRQVVDRVVRPLVAAEGETIVPITGEGA